MEEYIGKFFYEVSDPRSRRNQRYKFTTLIGTSLLEILSGVDSFSGMQDYIEMSRIKNWRIFRFK